MDVRSLAFNIDFKNINSSPIKEADKAMDDVKESMGGVVKESDKVSSSIKKSMDTSPLQKLKQATEGIKDKFKKVTDESTLIGRSLEKLKQTKAMQFLSQGMDKLSSSIVKVKDKAVGGLSTAFDRLKQSRIGEKIGASLNLIKGPASAVVGMAKGIGTAFQNGLDKIKKSASEAGKQLQELQPKMESLGKSMMTMVTAPIVAGATASINEFAKLEQSIGGVETLFKGSAGIVIANSESAYKRAGVSANDYMENITSFSASLLQGMGGNTKKAASVADMAMVDMSDNANKFGTDIGSVQNAYQGFAKDNFTMLDNLKLGYGGTKTEMQRLLTDATKLSGVKYKMDNFADMIEAIHVIQTEMGVTGTTTLEAMETVSGSIGMAKASLKDFLGGLGNSDANMDQLTQNMVESFRAAVDNIKRVLSTMWDNLPMAGWQKVLFGIATAAGPVIFILSKIIGVVLGIGPAFASIGSAIGLIFSPIGVLVGLFVGLIFTINHLWQTNEDFRNKVIGIWESIQSALGVALETIQQLWSTHGESIKSTLSLVFETIQQIVLFAFEFITSVVSVGVSIITSLWSTFGSTIMSVASVAWSMIQGIISGAMQIIQGVINVVLGLIQGDWSRVWTGIQGIFEGVMQGISAAWNGVKTLLSTVIKGAVEIVKDKFDSAVKSVKEKWESLKTFFKNPIKGTVSIVEKGINKLKGKGADGIHSSGAYNIPFNGYIGELHKGEMVLTKAASDAFRAMGGTENSLPKATNTTNNYSTSTTTVRSGESSNNKPTMQFSFSPQYNIELKGSATEKDKTELKKEMKRLAKESFEEFFYELNLKMS